MFTNIKVIVKALRGEIGDQYLQKMFWVFVGSLLIQWLIMFYVAFISRNFYSYQIDRLFGTEASYNISLVATILIAMMVIFLMSGIASVIMVDRKSRVSQHGAFIFVQVCVLALMLSLDIFANWSGKNYVAELATTAVREDGTVAIYDKVNMDIKSREDRIKAITECKVKGYCWKGSITAPGRKMIESLQAEILILRGQQTMLASHESLIIEEDRTRYTTQVSERKTGHGWLVILAYPIAFLLSCASSYYADKVLKDGGNSPGSRSAGFRSSPPFAMGQGNDPFEMKNSSESKIGFHSGNSAQDGAKNLEQYGAKNLAQYGAKNLEQDGAQGAKKLPSFLALGGDSGAKNQENDFKQKPPKKNHKKYENYNARKAGVFKEKFNDYVTKYGKKPSLRELERYLKSSRISGITSQPSILKYLKKTGLKTSGKDKD